MQMTLPVQSRCARHRPAVQEGEYAQAQLLTSRQELAQEKKGRQVSL